jgi:hypothetical protein
MGLEDWPAEVERDETKDYTRVWHCTPPAMDAKYRVLEDLWEPPTSAAKPVRHIRTWL